jgi:hypothetical protein
MTAYGYARVSTNGQDLGSQEAELLAARCAKVFKEKVSGAKTDRAELAKVIRRLEPGDVLVVTRLELATPTQGRRIVTSRLSPQSHARSATPKTRTTRRSRPRRLEGPRRGVSAPKVESGSCSRT